MNSDSELSNFITNYKFEYPIQYLLENYKSLKKNFNYERQQSIQLLYLYCLCGEAMIIHLAALTDDEMKFFEYIFAKNDDLGSIVEQLKSNAQLRTRLLEDLFDIKTDTRLNSYSSRLEQIVKDYQFFNSYLNSFKHGLRLTSPNVKVEQELSVASADAEDWKTILKTDAEVTCYSRKSIAGSRNYEVIKDTYVFNANYILENINFCIKVIERLISYDKSRVSIPKFVPGKELMKKSESLFTVGRN